MHAVGSRRDGTASENTGFVRKENSRSRRSKKRANRNRSIRITF